MLYLFVSLLTSASMVLLFKYFERTGIPTLQGIVWNYLTCFILCSSFSMRGPVWLKEVWQFDWFPLTLALGGLFVAIFYCSALTAQRIAVSVSVVAGKMSVVIPVTYAVLVWGEPMNALKGIGIAGALVAVYLTTKRDEQARMNGLLMFFLPLLTFLGSGLVDTSLNYLQKFYFTGNDVNEQLTIIFGTAGVIGGMILLVRAWRKKETLVWKSAWGGGLLGLSNYISTYCMLKTLNMGILPTSAILPILNIGIVAVSAAGARFFFQEKLSKTNLIGIAMAMAFIAVIAMG